MNKKIEELYKDIKDIEDEMISISNINEELKICLLVATLRNELSNENKYATEKIINENEIKLDKLIDKMAILELQTEKMMHNAT